MKIKDEIKKIRDSKIEDLRKELDKAHLEAEKARLEVESKKSSKTSELKKQRKNIARILTVINQKHEE